MRSAKFTDLTVGKHAIDEAVRDFRVSRNAAEDWIRSNLRKSEFVANVVSWEGSPGRLYAYQRTAFILDAERDFVVTVYPVNHDGTTGIHKRVRTAVRRELAKAERIERAVERRVRVEKARLRVERAKCQWRMEMTPSKSVIAANTRKVAEIDEKLTQLDAELLRARKEKSSVAKSVVMFL